MLLFKTNLSSSVNRLAAHPSTHIHTPTHTHTPQRQVSAEHYVLRPTKQTASTGVVVIDRATHRISGPGRSDPNRQKRPRDASNTLSHTLSHTYDCHTLSHTQLHRHLRYHTHHTHILLQHTQNTTITSHTDTYFITHMLSLTPCAHSSKRARSYLLSQMDNG